MITRSFYPRPQFVREGWQNLNGLWKFCFDDGNKRLEEKWYLSDERFDYQIQVLFVYQCRLSGIADDKIHEIVWYKRKFQLDEQCKERILLHFGAADYQAMVFINGNLVCEHEGGNTPFTVDISDYIVEGEQSIAVRVVDPSREELIPRGKQSWEEKPNLFDVVIILRDESGNVLDRIESYFGFRKVHKENGMVYLNNKPYYQRLILCDPQLYAWPKRRERKI